jgi:uncharacterized protein (TIGR03086 family)
MLINPALVQLHRRAVQCSVEIVSAVTADQLGWPTPCAGWALGDLLGHMIAQHHGFAAAADGSAPDLSGWAARPVGDDPAGEYAAAAQRVITAFGASGVLGRRMWLPELRADRPFPAATAIGFHLVDYVVHGWDVAASLGAEADYASDVVAAALVVAEQVPSGAAREAPGSAFRPALPVGAGRSPMQRLLLILGRSPAWPDP